MTEKKKLSFITRAIIVVFGFLLVADAVLGLVLMHRSVNRMKSIIQNKALEVAMSASNFLDGEEIASLTVEDHDNKTEKYMNSYNILHNFKTSSIDSNAGLAYIYCLVKNSEGKVVFSVDPSEGEEASGFLQEEIGVLTDACLAAFEGTPGADPDAYDDRWGYLLSAYVPVYAQGAEKTGPAKVVVGVDVWGKWYEQEIAENAISIGIIVFATIAVGLATTLFVTLRIRNRFNTLSREMTDLQVDVQDLIKNVKDPKYTPISDNVAELSENDHISYLKHQIENTRQEIKNYILYTHKQAYTDLLTGLGNRNAYFDRVNKIEKKMNDKEEISFSVILFDINGLKYINDTYGHESGDSAIMISGDCLIDAFGDNNAYRIGGDELVVIYDAITKEELDEKIKFINNEIKKKSDELMCPFDLSLSVGFSVFDKEKDELFKDVFNRADEEMYKEKTSFYKKTGFIKRKI